MYGIRWRDRRAQWIEERRELQRVWRIIEGVYATRTSADWTRLSRQMVERRWMRDPHMLELLTHPTVQRRLTNMNAEWPMELWPGRVIWMGMARSLEAEQPALTGPAFTRPALTRQALAEHNIANGESASVDERRGGCFAFCDYLRAAAGRTCLTGCWQHTAGTRKALERERDRSGRGIAARAWWQGERGEVARDGLRGSGR